MKTLIEQFNQAASKGNIDEVERLIGKGIDVRSEGSTALTNAIISGDLDLLKYLLCKGAKIDESSRCPSLYWAVYSGNLNIVRYLVETLHVDIHQEGDLALRTAKYSITNRPIRRYLESYETSFTLRKSYSKSTKYF